MSRKFLWRRGEKIAMEYLISRGYSIVERNYRTRIGEIDIITARDRTIAFVEVRTRKSAALGPPEYSITPRKVSRIARVASHYIKNELKCSSEWKFAFDVVTVEIGDSSPVVRHLKNLYIDR